MARISVSDEEIQLRKRARRRLVGAVALVLIVVAVVPLVLDRAPRPSKRHIDVQMPPASEPAAERAAGASPAAAAPPAAGSVPDTPPDRAAAAVAPSLAADSAATAAESRVAAAAPSVPEIAEPPPVQAQASRENKSGDAYAVPVIATLSPEKARDFKQRLIKSKFPVYLEKTPDGAKTRVRVGPYKRKDAAEQARQRLVALGFDPGKVVRKGE